MVFNKLLGLQYVHKETYGMVDGWNICAKIATAKETDQCMKRCLQKQASKQGSRFPNKKAQTGGRIARLSRKIMKEDVSYETGCHGYQQAKI